MRNKNLQKQIGFTLIELLVVIAIIGILAAVAMVAMQSGRQKSRDAKRLSDMTQMNTYMELYNAKYKGYPDDADSNGEPDDLAPEIISALPKSPVQADGSCGGNYNPCGNPGQPACVPANNYFYVPVGTFNIIDGRKVWPDYNYHFCLGAATGDFQAGEHAVNPTGVK